MCEAPFDHGVSGTLRADERPMQLDVRELCLLTAVIAIWRCAALTEDEARRLMTLPKFGDPIGSWTQMRGHPGTATNAFGVLDIDGAAIRGLQIEFLIFRQPRLAVDRLTFTLRLFELGRLQRVYQQEINPRPRLRPADHAYSHEHIGPLRLTASPNWSTLSFPLAVRRFCEACNLTLSEPLPDFDAFDLR